MIFETCERDALICSRLFGIEITIQAKSFFLEFGDVVSQAVIIGYWCDLLENWKTTVTLN